MEEVQTQPMLKVGELARRTGLSVRTLHHYDEIGLLRPASRTRSRHRLYGPEDIARLQQIASLRQLGLSLGDIRTCLDGGGLSALEVVERQIGFVRKHIRTQERLYKRLERMASRMRASEPTPTAELIHVIEETTMFEKHYSEDQLDLLARRRQRVGRDRLKQVQTEWTELFAALDAERTEGTAPDDERVLAIVRRGRDLIAEFTGGNAGIQRSLSAAYSEDSRAFHRSWGIGKDLADYYRRATEALTASEAGPVGRPAAPDRA